MSSEKPDLSNTLSKLNDTLEKSAPKTRRERREEEREERRERKKKKELENASTVGGVFTLAVALIMLGYAIYNPHMWWLIFVALGIGSGGARQLSLAAKKNKEALPEKTSSEPAKEQQHEIDALCDQLLSDLRESPEVVRSFLQDPEKTVVALRQTAKAVDQRRKDLSTHSGKEQLAALEKQRAELKARRDGSSDPVAREKFDGALRSLDGQEAALKQLSAVADRLDGEYTSLLVLLQELKTRVAVARSTNSTSQQAGLEQSVQRLNAELEAITDSLQKAQTDGLLSPIDARPMAGVASTAERQRE
ncbi:MAG: hypothetical protein JNM17_03505 [Archangium sp.]|nr:hypothetical protein [Archangium sp.]